MSNPSSPFADVEVRVQDRADFLARLANFARWARERSFAWRGQANIDWPLHSSLFRRLRDESDQTPQEDDLVSAEASITEEARLWHLHRHASGALTPLEFWATLQHFGVPTRMLDFSFSALVATWFAVEDEEHARVDGAVFAVEVGGFMRSVAQSWGDLAGDPPWKEVGAEFLQCWAPPPLDGRMGLQHSCFVYGRVPEQPDRASIPLDFTGWKAERIFKDRPGKGTYPKRPVAVLRIPAKEKAHLRALLLHMADLDHRTVFGDLTGFAAYRGRGKR